VRGLGPPLGEGFRAFLSAQRIDEAVRRELNTALEQDVHDPYDSHPTLRQRLAALGAGPDDDPPPAGPPASTLLRDHADLEAGILRALTGDAIETLPSATWDDVEQDWLRRYAVMVDARRSALAGHRVGDVPALAADPGPLVAALRAEWPDAFAEHADALARELLGAALTVALVRDGFAFDVAPGEPMSCRRGEHCFLPFVDVAEVAERPDRGWVLEYRIVSAGVYDAPLGDASAEPNAAVTRAAVERHGPTRPPLEPYRPGEGFAAGAATCFRWLLNFVAGILGLALGTFVVTSILFLVVGPGMIVGYSWAGRVGQVIGGLGSLALVGFIAFRMFRHGRAAALRNAARRARENPFVRAGGGR